MKNSFDNIPKPKQPKIERVMIPDEGATEWIKVYHQAGFSSEEIDQIMMNLNKTSRDIKDPKFIEKKIEEEINKTVEDARKRGHIINDGLKSMLRRSLENKYQD
jgi:hypothetical protein